MIHRDMQMNQLLCSYGEKSLAGKACWWVVFLWDAGPGFWLHVLQDWWRTRRSPAPRSTLPASTPDAK